MSRLECKDFSVKYFGYDAAISGVTTTFFGGINVIYAAEKSGKTTLLKALAGLTEYKGELTLDGVDLRDISLKDRDFQMLFDDYALFSRHSARYNLEYPLKLRKVPKEERRARVEEAAALFDLDLMIDAPVYRLNEWHKVSLVLCRAYLRSAKVLLIDNIFAKLDPASRHEAFLRYLPLFADRGIVVYATDLADEAAALSREIKLLSYGYLLQEGSAADFHLRPSCLSAFTAFEEYPSVLPCVIGEQSVSLCGAVFPANALCGLISDVYLGKEAVAAFAPGDLALSDHGFEATVTGRFFSDGESVYALSAAEHSLFVKYDRELTTGEVVRVAVRSVTRLFDRVNERAILRYEE